MNWRLLLLALCAMLIGGHTASAQGPAGDIHVAAALEAETMSPAPGSTVTLAISMKPDVGWHGYWVNPGDAGQGIQLDWSLPVGVGVGPLRFPVPETLIISGFMNYVYERPHAILVDLKIPASAKPGTQLSVGADALWLACTDRVCVPQQGRLTTTLTVGDGRIDTATRQKFDSWRAALPVPLDQAGSFAIKGDRLTLAIPYPAGAKLDRPYFFPLTGGAIDYAAAQKYKRSGDWLVVETRLTEGGAPTEIEGLLRIGMEQGIIVGAKPGPVPGGGVPISAASSPVAPATPPIWWLLLGALAGGILLNIMPCVFPILGLKALALAKAGGDERTARADALAYSAGVILSCVALGAIMLALRAGGQEIGWAFQLQEPGFVLFLLLLMTAITANLLGLFEIGGLSLGDNLTRKSGWAGSFWTGALAALVATPCTGPFMAAALGAALLLPVAEALLLFAVLGLGIALPFLTIAYIPALRTRLPKPGPWLNIFRKVMAVPMGLTAIGLLWLLWRLTGFEGLLVGGLAAILVLGVATLRFEISMVSGGLTRFLMAVGVFGLALQLLPTESASPVVSESRILKSDGFSETRLAALRAEGKPVFVYFTADWCLTCKVNEAAVLEKAETAKLFADNGVTVLRGDFTRRDPVIARFLSQQGAAGVPLYLYYPKGGEAQTLPQILTPTVLRNVLN
jgi:DsbC/DsbD-like thiol-disulfide interchange protein/cytochrome c biogenesis protein CcdA